MDRRDSAEDKVAQFYTGVGWKTEAGVTEDAKRFEDLREVARDYLHACRMRVRDHIPPHGDRLLDMASGPIQYPEYLTYSEGYAKRVCVDLSADALEAARAKLGDRGEYWCGSWLTMPVEPNQFDCAISLHTIYHIAADRQAEAVRKLVHAVKPGKPVVIVYSNPKNLVGRVRGVLKRAGVIRQPPPRKAGEGLYVHAHPLAWWTQFSDVARVELYPWRALQTRDQRTLIPDSRVGKAMLGGIARLEDALPGMFTRLGQYPMIVLTKRG